MKEIQFSTLLPLPEFVPASISIIWWRGVQFNFYIMLSCSDKEELPQLSPGRDPTAHVPMQSVMHLPTHARLTSAQQSAGKEESDSDQLVELPMPEHRYQDLELGLVNLQGETRPGI